MSNPIFDAAREQARDVQYVDNNSREGADACAEVIQIINDIEDNHNAIIAALKAENEQLFQVANRAMACVLNMPINKDSAPEIIELDRYMAHEISEELNERLDGCITEKKQP